MKNALFIFILLLSSSLLALDWTNVTGGRVAPLNLPAGGQTGFLQMSASQIGIDFTNSLALDRHLTNQIFLNGSGVAAGDVDGDGWCDLFFAGLDHGGRLFKNLGQWQFKDITQTSFPPQSLLDTTGAVFADVDGDGDLDLLVNTLGHGSHVFFNDGSGHFTESPANARLNVGMAGMSLALADIDGDGDLDLYVANYRTSTIRDQPNTHFTIRMVDGKPTVAAIGGRPLTDPDLTNRFDFHIDMANGQGTFAHDENGEPDALFLNDGRGHFTPAPFTGGRFLDESGVALSKPPFDWGLSIAFRDLNGDGAPDIYVCNDFKTPDRIWLNDGHGHFRAAAPLSFRQLSLSSMGVDFADINRDGFDDIFVVDMLSRDHARRFTQRFDFQPGSLPIGAIENRPQYPRNTLFLNRGNGTYAEVAQMAGLEATEWSWTPIFLDVDLDGYEDLLVSNGFERDNMNADILMRLEAAKRDQKLSSLEQLQLRKMFPKLETANLAFRNQGNLSFSDQSKAWGFNASGVSQGMALADLDNDGDLDVIINNLNSPPLLYRNETLAPRIAIRLRGAAPNTRGIGAKIRILSGPLIQSQELQSGGRYLSSDDPQRTFAAGKGPMNIEVMWRNRQRTVLSNAQPNCVYEIAESSSQPVPSSNEVVPPALFEDVSALLQHVHHQEAFDDFAFQPLLPRRFSQPGPGLSFYDVDGDGWDDLLISSGKGGALGFYRNNGRGGFVKDLSLNQTLRHDQPSLLGWRKPGGQTVILAGSSNYEDASPDIASVTQYDVASRSVLETFPGQPSSTGPLAMADVHGDGQLELFVGGRVLPRRFPEPASSMLFRHTANGWVSDEPNTKALARVGLVQGATFSDLDADGLPDLILACHWGSLKVFHNDHGKLVEKTEAFGLSKFTGLWNGVAVGDFDEDGRMDIVASNWGRNTPYESYRANSVHLFYADFDGNGILDVVEAGFDPILQKLVPLQPFLQIGKAIPVIREKMGSFENYAHVSVQEIYGEKLNSAGELQVNWLDTTLFLNRGDHFEAHALPMEAQMAPAFALCVADFDGDGHEDLFLGQNFFATQPEASRYDAGCGLLLKGDGTGAFRAVPARESGLTIYGEQRAAACADFDADGRMDLAISQNGAETKLYKNRTARPGLRVRLRGPVGNPDAIGAVLRWLPAGGKSPASEVHCGSGYCSQDSAVQVLARPSGPARLQVRWPSGPTHDFEIPETAREISIDPQRGVQVLRPDIQK